MTIFVLLSINDDFALLAWFIDCLRAVFGKDNDTEKILKYVIELYRDIML